MDLLESAVKSVNFKMCEGIKNYSEKLFEAFVVVEPHVLLGKWLFKAFVTK